MFHRKNLLIHHAKVILMSFLKEYVSSESTYSDIVVYDDEVGRYTINTSEQTIEQIEVIKEVVLAEVAI